MIRKKASEPSHGPTAENMSATGDKENNTEKEPTLHPKAMRNMENGRTERELDGLINLNLTLKVN